MGRLEGKSVLITGAASGMGRSASLLFAREGASVLAMDKSEAAEVTSRQINEAGGAALAIMGDAGSERDVSDAIDLVVATFGKLDVVWANAGISGGWVSLHDQTVEQWSEMLRINLIGPFLAVKLGSAQMMRQQTGGSIICTASVAGLKANAGVAHYSAAKAGVISLVQTSAYALAGTGIRVNAICPGLVETGMTKPTFDRARERGSYGRIGAINPTQRAGQPDEIASVGLFLASDDSSYVNGQAIAVDGGLSASVPYAGKLRP
jgi:NAD(P)-dependent dehydrogenase (short-subunit alcohol dehydrogenase family)